MCAMIGSRVPGKVFFVRPIDDMLRDYSALIAEGDPIRLDLKARTLDLLVDDAELERRRSGWKPLESQFDFGVLRKYAKLVGSAANGAVCD